MANNRRLTAALSKRYPEISALDFDEWEPLMRRLSKGPFGPIARFLFRASSAKRPRPHGVDLAIEPLESRALLSIMAAGPELAVNSHTTDYQSAARVATDADGDFVVVWQSAGQDGAGYGVFAQRYSANGIALGTEFQVNQQTASNEFEPSVAMDAGGDFVVAWTSYQDGSGYGVFARRYDASGAALGNEFQVNVATVSLQGRATVAMDTDGDFVVAWQSFGQDGAGYGVFARRFDAAGAALGGEIQVNVQTTGNQFVPSIAMDADGDFVVAWASGLQDGAGYGVFARRFSASGAALGGEFAVNTYTTNSQFLPSVATDDAGAFVVAWSSYLQDGSGYGVYAQRYDAAGAAVGGEFRVNSVTLGSQAQAVVSTDAIGNFVVAWSSQDQDGDEYGVFAQSYNASGTAQGGEVALNSFTTSSQFNPSVAMDADGDFVAAWTSNGQDGDGYGAFAQRFDVADIPSLTESQVNTQTTSNQFQPAIASDANGNYVVVWSGDGQDGSGYGVYLQRYDASGSPQGGEIQVNAYTTSAQWFPAVAMDASGDFVVAWTSYQDGSSYGVFARRFNASGVALGGEFLVNSQTLGLQIQPTIAMDADGDFVVAWQSFGQDGAGYGVFAQRYDASGSPLGGEFQVNTYPSGNQFDATVAMDAAGAFLVAWTSGGQDGSGYGVYAQRYDAAGVALGNEFRVNATTMDSQFLPSATMDASGAFVVAWSSDGQDGSSYGVVARRFDASGIAQGGEFVVNTVVADSQTQPTVAMDADGDFVVAWSSRGEDGAGYGVFARRYNAAAVARGDAFRLNAFTTQDQSFPVVAMDADGDFAIAWTSYGQDGAGYGVFAQRYEALPPIAAVVGPGLAVRGAPTSFTLTASDTPADPSEVFTFEIDWDNNGTVDETVVGLGAGLVVDHVFTETASPTVRVVAIGSDGRPSAAATWSLEVVPYALVANGGQMDLVIGGTTGSDFYSFWGLGGREVGVITTDIGVFRAEGVTGQIRVYMQDGDDTVTIERGMDSFNFGADLGDGFNIFAPISGTHSTYYVAGGDGVDQFFLAGAGHNTAYFLGGGGDDVFLDVSGEATNASVVFGGDGNDGAAGGLGGDFFYGEAGNDMLVGGFSPVDGADYLNGGEGDDFLVGGPGADVLDGEADHDLVVAGSLVFLPVITDGYLPIWAEWGSSGGSFASRVSFVSGASGGLNDPYFLVPGDTALDDGVVDTVFGRAGEDLLVYDFSQDFAADYAVGIDVRINIG